MVVKFCPGCEQPFQTSDPRKEYCRKGCGRKREGRVQIRTSEESHLARTVKRAAHEVQFIGLDGEGIDTPDGQHRYVVLSIGDTSYHLNGERLTTEFIFESLWTEFKKHPTASFVGFALGYDFSQWLQDLPEKHALKLYRPQYRKRPPAQMNPTPYPVEWFPWQFDILGSKRFKLRKGKNAPWMYICDTFGFWQASFVKTIDPRTWTEPICTQDEFDIILAGKSNRAVATFDDDMLRYNTLENEVLARLMARLNRGYVKMGVRLNRKQWFGPGQAAQEWLKLIQAPKSVDVHEATPKQVIDAARGSFFGGWFEITTHGHVGGDSYEYDINSAYPSIIANLPCLLHGHWTETKTAKAAPWQLVYGTWHGSSPRLGPHMCRNKYGVISRCDNTGWAWRHEIDAARRAKLIDSMSITKTLTYTPCGCKPPLQAIAGLYEDRLRVGKSTPEGKAMKLVYNSCYGKFAQSVGHPMFANSIYASLITAGCRTQILDAIATHPMRAAGVLMIATDAVYFRSPHPTLPVTAELGDWDAVTKHNLTLMMPGVYWDDKSRDTIRRGETPVLKSRGVSGRYLAQMIDNIDQQWSDWTPDKPWPEADITIDFMVTSGKSAIHRGKWELCGQIQHGVTRTLSADPSNKRRIVGYDALKKYAVPYTENYTWISNVNHYLIPPVSVPYDQAIGEEQFGSEDFSLVTTEGPYNLLECLAP